jgi:hypothetical protein
MLVGILGPEFVTTYVSGQLGTSTDSVKASRAIGGSVWTIQHGSSADVGGCLIVPPTGKLFPGTGKHIYWLVTKGYLDFPNVTSAEMADKSKQDTIAKVATCFQISYLVLQCISRYVQGFTITSMELFDFAIVICSIMTNLCWLKKNPRRQNTCWTPAER